MTLETSASDMREKEGSEHMSGVWACSRGSGSRGRAEVTNEKWVGDKFQ